MSKEPSRPVGPFGRALVVAWVLGLLPATAHAYPSSVVFSPNGEAKPLGTVGLLAYGAVNLAPAITPGSSWFGVQAGHSAHHPTPRRSAAYESPLFAGRVGLVVDYLGGSSEISDTYIGAVLNISSTTTFGGGAFVANDRTGSPDDGTFFYLTETFDVTKLTEKL